MSAAHIVPIADQVEHTIPGGWDDVEVDPVGPSGGWAVVEVDPDVVDPGCACGPRVELAPGKGPDVWLRVHPSLDGREARE